MEQKPEAEEDAAPAASTASQASKAAADAQSITKAHAAAFEETVASEGPAKTEKDEQRQNETKEFGPSYKKGRRRRSTNKNESVKSAKRSKIFSGETRGRKDKIKFRRS